MRSTGIARGPPPALDPQDSAAALLHREEIPNAALALGKNRFVLAMLKGWDETQLRSPDGRIVVYRNKVNAQGEMATGSHTARLVQFDAPTGLALLTYVENFDYGADIGLHVDRAAAAPSDLVLLRTFSEGEEAPVREPRTPEPRIPEPRPPDPRLPRAQMPDPRMYDPRMPDPRAFAARAPARVQPFSSDAGIFHRPAGKTGTVELPPLKPQATGDPVQLAVSGEDWLIAFVQEAPDGAVVVTPVSGFSVAIKTPFFKVKNVTFEGNGGSVRLKLDIEATAPELLTSELLNLRVREIPAGTVEKPAPSDAAGLFKPVETNMVTTLSRNGKSGPWTSSLSGPETGGERAYLLQISWPLLGESRTALGYDQAFLVKLERRPDGVYPTVEGLGGAAAHAAGAGAPPAPDAPAGAGPATPFPLEAAVRNVSLMAGGREALLELQGAPHWKRFSFEKNTWLPLPAGDLSNVFLAGNLSALFVLDRGSGEVRKYALGDLKPAGAVKLPGSAEYLAILAGCNSDHAPVQVLAVDDALALAPETLQRRDTPRYPEPNASNYDRKFTRNERYFTTGDGLGFTSIGASRTEFHAYNSDARGLELRYADLGNLFSTNDLRGVSAAFANGEGLRCAATPGGATVEHKLPAPWNSAAKSLAPNCPVLFRLRAADKNAVPPKPPKLALFSYFDTAPFAEVEAPELAGVQGYEAWKGERQVFFDPYSLRLATLSADKKTWFVRQLTAPEKRDQPVLLNWPDTSLARGGEFRFRPLLWGGKKFAAEVFAKPGLASVNEADGTVQFAVAAREFASLRLLTLKVPGKDGAELSYPVPLHVAGPELPFAAPVAAERSGINARGAGFKSLGTPVGEYRALPAATYSFPDPIADLQGPVAGCLALVTTTNRVDFFSLKDRKIVGKITGPAGAHYYAGAGALFEYDPGKRTLTRLSVPDGRREQTLTFPENLVLKGIGMGTENTSPVALAVNVTESKATTRLGDLTITDTTFHALVTVRDGHTLQTAGWAQPIPLTKMLRLNDRENNAGNYTFGLGDDGRPTALPASHSGRIMYLPNCFLALAPAYAVAYPLELSKALDLFRQAERNRPSGSISGLMAVAPSGQAFKGGTAVGGERVPSAYGGTPCGRYVLAQSNPGGGDDACLEIRLSENNKPLLLAARLAFLNSDRNYARNPAVRRVTMLGDEGPLAIFDPAARTMQLVDFNIPAVMKELAPDDFHVTSQPMPCVVAGAVLQYQVQVNNPDAVQSYRLQAEVPGARLSPQGFLQFTAPPKITGPVPSNISIEIIGKKGQILLHEFPIHILPAAGGADLRAGSTGFSP